jgi:DNA uptake protein ComE-like DNA-binding protein
MKRECRVVPGLVPAIAAMVLMAATVAVAQVGASKGVVDANTAGEQALAAMPHMTPARAKALVVARPFAGIKDLNAFVLGQGLTPAQAEEFYRAAFVHVDLNTATREEILLIPGAGERMAREFAEYRPWKTWAQFHKEIGKYVGEEEAARLGQYGFIPIRLNGGSDADILTIPGVGPRMLGEFKEYRPWKTMQQFHREIGKYVDEKEVKRLARYVVID